MDALKAHSSLEINEKDFFSTHRNFVEENEACYLHGHAALSKSHTRYFGAEQDHRLPYKRDVDRIVHSKAYARYVDKTQVVYLVKNDHITHRSLHVQLVSNFARGIAEILRLNLDLVEAIALGHDVGHPPFGHEGERYLSKLAQEYGLTAFAHPWQSCHLFTHIEPLNLGLNVYDGFLCHDGGMQGCVLKPHFGKSWEDHFKERNLKLKDPDFNIIPGTMEGCLVKLCDTISYLGRDIEDAIQLKILDRKMVPKTILGTSNGEILSFVARDIIKNSYGKDYIALSEEVFEALKLLRQFNFKHIYVHPLLKVESKKIQRSYRILLETLLNDHQKNRENSHLWSHFLHNKTESYRSQFSEIQQIFDYIAGMTDNYFVRTLQQLIVPMPIEL
ncbi:HD domain-containing protein [Parachlamydia sp. AcF125]|uniref:deoxyguanosinetriphosphate triphosphohydrolase family protein n=1 Tax=Parachlamydia sp. AcF125 TaxID=2795736 RepID=UPI001BC9B3C3|nr:HD domain-containing protein [Parachlamydia sp. AcF125]MBS4167960.1 Deoxyguanosinetriphosphate triphosphohydrolase-like protein [Parachlamydia sp. AcF125]